jgi:hypothetical protein
LLLPHSTKEGVVGRRGRTALYSHHRHGLRITREEPRSLRKRKDTLHLMAGMKEEKSALSTTCSSPWLPSQPFLHLLSLPTLWERKTEMASAGSVQLIIFLLTVKKSCVSSEGLGHHRGKLSWLSSSGSPVFLGCLNRMFYLWRREKREERKDGKKNRWGRKLV